MRNPRPWRPEPSQSKHKDQLRNGENASPGDHSGHATDPVQEPTTCTVGTETNGEIAWERALKLLAQAEDKLGKMETPVLDHV